MSKLFGIDLGTTYSVIATTDDNDMPIVITNTPDEDQKLASAVYFEPGGNIVVGTCAKDGMNEPDRVIQFVKREIGKDDKEWTFDGEKYNPITISSLILKKMKDYAEQQGYEVKDVVITCPAYFGNEELLATRQAGEIAGFNVLDIVREPTAAAVNYCARAFKEEKKLLVYDLGGGTFDVSLIDFSENENGKYIIKVKSTEGNDRLGGKDWDERLFEYACDKYSDEMGMDVDEIEDEPKTLAKASIEEIKKKLSSKEKNYVYFGPDRIELQREEFEERTHDLVAQTMLIVDKLIDENKDFLPNGASDIDIVLLVGGSTRMPMISEAVKEKFGAEKVMVEDPDLAVAKGAALYAKITEETTPPVPSPDDEDGSKGSDSTPPTGGEDGSKGQGTSPIGIVNVLSKAFGIRALGSGSDNKYLYHFVYKDETSPIEVTRTEFGTAVDNQPKLIIPIYESKAKDKDTQSEILLEANGEMQETDPVLEVKEIGQVELEIPSGKPKGYKVNITFKCSAGNLEVIAEDPETGKTVKSEIQAKNLMSKSEVEAAKDAMQNTNISSEPSA